MKALKIIGAVLGVVLVLIVALLSYVKFVLPNTEEPQTITIEPTQERIARGKYLANSVMACVDCHSERDFSKFAGPIDSTTIGKGGELFGTSLGFPGDFYAPNLTPYHLKDWTDGEILRAITTGVSKDGHTLFPVMPWQNYATLDQEDLYSIIAYLRTLKSIENDVPKSEPSFPINFILNTMPKPAQLSKRPPREDIIKYGEYITKAASCKDCHTIQIDGEYQMDKYMAGGFKFPLPSGDTVRSANITPSKETGIGLWTADSFVARFKAYDSGYVNHSVADGSFNSMMPWTCFGTMHEEDLRAIFSYLQTVTPIENTVVKFTPQ